MGEIPINEPGHAQDRDRVKRYRDCAVIEATHELVDESDRPAFDTVRCLFPEGRPAFEGSGILHRSHIQLCVRKRAAIRGYFCARDPASGETIDWATVTV